MLMQTPADTMDFTADSAFPERLHFTQAHWLKQPIYQALTNIEEGQVLAPPRSKLRDCLQDARLHRNQPTYATLSLVC